MSATGRGRRMGSGFSRDVPAVLFLLFLFALNLSAGCSKDASGVPKAEDPRKKMAVPVTVGTAVVPSQAIQSGQQGQYVFVVKDDSTVEYRPVDLGEMLDGETVISKGVAPGERVVTDGQLRLASGSLVQTVEDSPNK